MSGWDVSEVSVECCEQSIKCWPTVGQHSICSKLRCRLLTLTIKLHKWLVISIYCLSSLPNLRPPRFQNGCQQQPTEETKVTDMNSLSVTYIPAFYTCMYTVLYTCTATVTLSNINYTYLYLLYGTNQYSWFARNVTKNLKI